jgi:tRNA threonylcarbamoyladenosine biosynthesis protein TsaE
MNTEFQKIHISTSEKETEALGAALAQELAPGSIVLLCGDLGAGKTVFSRGFARGLGVTEPVSSPTYTIVQEYELPTGNRLYHMDLYRITDERAALGFGVDEFLSEPDAFSLVEWPERIAGLLPDTAIRVELKHRSEDEREIRILVP